MKSFFKKDNFCSNCKKVGHVAKNCTSPVLSLGVILVLLSTDQAINKLIASKLSNEKNEKVFGIPIQDHRDIEYFCEFKNQIKFLLIRRKHTLGFLEFIRGHYNIDNVDGIIFLFKQMTIDEIKKIKYAEFDDLWDGVWGEKKTNRHYQNEYNISKEKFTKLKMDDNGYLNLNFYVENVTPTFEFPEWGFPKGRKNFNETDLECAIREFREETGFNDDEIKVFDTDNPFVENFIGTNGVSYQHIYYIGIPETDRCPTIDKSNLSQFHEIGDIGYFTYEDAMKLIRPYHTERQKVLTHVYTNIMNILIKQLKQNI